MKSENIPRRQCGQDETPQNILEVMKTNLNISMRDVVAVHVLERTNQLVKEAFCEGFWQTSPSVDGFYRNNGP
jgi:hypothetical protein